MTTVDLVTNNMLYLPIKDSRKRDMNLFRETDVFRVEELCTSGTEYFLEFFEKVC